MRTKVRIPFQFLLVAPINKNCFTSRVETAVYISPPISDHETLCKINFERVGRLKQHSGSGFSALARISINRASVEASHNTINRKLLQHPCVNRLHRLTGESPAPD